MVPAAVLTQSKPVPITAVRLVSTAVPKISVTRPRQAKTVFTKTNSPPSRHINRSPSPKASNSPHRVTTVKAPIVNAAKGNMSYLSNFKELNSGYVAFGGNPKGGVKVQSFYVSQMCDKKNSVLFTDTECLVLSPEFKLPNENQVLLRVPKENNMYNVNLKNIVPS
nr:ribonuclease H-like domain-containing protein [Tanacetum cinerariifolium]